MSDLLGKVYKLPRQCPICGKTLVATVTQIEHAGEIEMVDQIEMTCITEPPMGSKRADEFYETHFKTPYIDWVPIQDSVKLAINKKVMAAHGLEYDSEFETWFDPKEPSDSPYNMHW
ncbi:hypothetical protein FAES_1811 [Fibrella aestuarina BUZ 2]|uniref:Uncharacterized protein n=1 Tax=Fibrella aestuarina BUZ 2 TaxID=1166018 RepID=I0K6R8_9BACT|nr:hypothetical protein [Fibrella aestuarina]CCG99821.1 hypothetical protein FAES_1811 [Fibrella aestuarina BUZ 2]